MDTHRHISHSLYRDLQEICGVVGDVYSYMGLLDVPSWRFPAMSADYVSLGNQGNSLKSLNCEQLMELIFDRFHYLLCLLNQYLKTNLLPLVLPPDSASHAGALELHATTVLEPDSRAIGAVTRICWERLRNLHLKMLQAKFGAGTEFHSHAPPSSADSSMYPACCKKLGTSSLVSKDDLSRSTQTEFSVLGFCESCRESETSLKMIGSQLELMVQEEAGSSAVAQCRAHLKDSVHRLTQLTAVGQWCFALNADAEALKDALVGRRAEISRIKGQVRELEKMVSQEREACAGQLKLNIHRAESLQQDLDEERRKGELRAERSKQLERQLEEREKQLQESKKQLQEEKHKTSQAASDNTDLKNQVEEMSAELQELGERSRFLEEQLGQSRVDIGEAEERWREAAAERERLQSLLEESEKELSYMQQQHRDCVSLSDQLHLTQEKRQELEEIQTLRLEQEHFQAVLKKMQTERDAGVAGQQQAEQQAELLAARVVQLEGRIDESQAREAVLLQYPDLNGPLRNPHTESGDILLDMKGQLSANKLRVKLLEEQNIKLERTINRVEATTGGGRGRYQNGTNH